jgi:transposase-like protein
VAKTARDVGIRAPTVRRWRDEEKHGKRAARRKRGKIDTTKDLRRFSDDAWDIIHKANEVVKDEVGEMAAKDAAGVAAGYFDRQARAEERLAEEGGPSEEYVAQWDKEEK